MTTVSDVGHSIELAVPAARGARWAVYAIGALVAGAALAFVVWWVFIHPRQLAQQGAQAKVDAKLGTAAGEIATHALPQINEAARQRVAVDVMVHQGEADVRSAPDAGVDVRGVSDALRRNLCLYGAYAADPACKPLHEDPAGVGTARPDSAGAAVPD